MCGTPWAVRRMTTRDCGRCCGAAAAESRTASRPAGWDAAAGCPAAAGCAAGAGAAADASSGADPRAHVASTADTPATPRRVTRGMSIGGASGTGSRAALGLACRTRRRIRGREPCGAPHRLGTVRHTLGSGHEAGGRRRGCPSCAGDALAQNAGRAARSSARDDAGARVDQRAEHGDDLAEARALPHEGMGAGLDGLLLELRARGAGEHDHHGAGCRAAQGSGSACRPVMPGI